MRPARYRCAVVFLLILTGALAACDTNTPPAPSGPPATVQAPTALSGTPAAPAPPQTPTFTPIPTFTSTPTATPTPLPTEGAVRTPAGGAAGPEFAVALAAMDAAPSYSYTLRLELGTPPSRYVLTGTGVYQPPAGYDTSFNALGFPSEVLVLSDTTYVRTDGTWQQGTPGPVLYPMGAPPDMRGLLGLTTYATSAALVGDGNATLDGVPLRHLRFQLHGGGLLGPGNGLGTAGGEVWIDTTAGRFRRLLYTFGTPGTPGDNDGTLQIDFGAYGIPVELTPPPLP